MAKKVLTVASFGLLGSKLLGGKKKAAPEKGPVVMPLADDEAVKRARRKSIAAQMSRGGRNSTILSDGDSLGGY
jgi:hypothetical protein